ncbi:MAG: hypothetical protein OXH20_12705, partial [bacterium]|nr:hypothetical protein [bacterium]
MTGFGPSDGAAFLPEREPLSWTAPAGFPVSLRPAALYLQDANPGLEVAVATAARPPGAVDLRAAWRKRQAGRPNPVLLVALYGTAGEVRAALCGPVGEQPPVHTDVALSRARRLAAAALGEPTHQAATRFLLAALGEVRSEMPGLRNVGLLATQQLLVTAAAIRSGGRPLAGGPATAAVVGSPAGDAAVLLGLRGRPLVEALGFEVQVLAAGASLLRIDGRGRAVAVFCDEGEPFDAPAGRFDGASPVSRGLALADTENLDWLVLTRGAESRLYAARADVGVGRKGRAESFVELNLTLLADDLADFLPLLFSADALRPGGSLEVLLAESAVFAADLAKRLRERVYYKTVPSLAGAVARRMGPNPSPQDLDDAYEQVMVILFRLLFVAYAEDSDLLPYRSNDRYADHSLKKMARRLADDRNDGRLVYDAEACDDWEDVRQLWRAVDRGNRGWGVPAYNGGLFSSDPAVSRAGAAVARLELPDAEFAPALADLLVDEGESRHEGWGPVDFRSLSVREFGTIYEGLLESRLAVAASDLTVRTVKGADTYVPAGAGDAVEVAAGGVYLHNRSGVRKATGSYFTKPFAVEHLLDHALEPALDDHVARLEALREAGDDAALAAAFFDFRCADIAMGSGHFLVAALDRIEARLSGWLARHPVPAVTAELNRLRDTALEALGDAAAGTEIETGSLLRRQVARHCVYGVDRNRVAVELARLSIWVHTFVPGLPLSLLDHNLVCGDSLTGVGTLDEAVAALERGVPKSGQAAKTPRRASGAGGAASGTSADSATPVSLFDSQLTALLARAIDALARYARTSDATRAEIDEAIEAQVEAHEAVAAAVALFDLVTAERAGAGSLPERFHEETFLRMAAAQEVRETVEALQPVHFPAAQEVRETVE